MFDAILEKYNVVENVVKNNFEILYHSKQAEISNDKHRFKIAIIGRQFGKTYLLSLEAIKQALLSSNRIIWIVAPVYAQTLITSRYISRFLNPKLKKKNNKRMYDSRDIVFINGSVIQFRTAIQPDRLRGEKLDWLGGDEVGLWKPEIWYECLSPTLSINKGSALLLGTPKGKNWVYQEFLKGQDKNDDIISWQISSKASPYFDIAEYERAKLNTPAITFEQEYNAQFVANSTSVFYNFYDCLFEVKTDYEGKGYIKFDKYKQNEKYIMGVDVGVLSSWTVVTVLNVSTGYVVAFHRLQRTSYKMISENIYEVAKEYGNCEVWIDRTGIGYSIYEDLYSKGCFVQGFNFTNSSRTELIQYLQLSFEHKAIKIPDIKILVDEIKDFEYILKNGLLFYNSNNQFSDCVYSLALAVFDYKTYEWPKNQTFGGIRL